MIDLNFLKFDTINNCNQQKIQIMANYNHHDPDYKEMEDCMYDGMDCNDYMFEQVLSNL
jgi:hypothetical protein